MPGQVVMEAPLHQLPPMQQLALGHHHQNCKHDATAATMAASDMAYFQQQQQLMLQQPPPAANPNTPSAREQCPRCASHDTKFCYYNNYNTSQPRHFCRACRRYWTLGGSLRNVPIGGSTRKRMRPALQPMRRPPVHFGGPPPPMPMPMPAQCHSQSQQQGGGLLGSLFALGGAPLLEGRVGFDLGLGLPGLSLSQAGLGGSSAGEFGLHSLGLRGGHAGTTSSAPMLWPTGFLDSGGMDTWKLSGGGASAMWAPEFSSAPAVAQVGGMFRGGGAGAQIM